MQKILKSKWLTPAIAVMTYLFTTGFLLMQLDIDQSEPVHEEESTAAYELQGTPGASWNFTNSELEDLIQQLRDKETDLVEREDELAEREQAVANEKAEIKATTNYVHQLQQQLERLFVVIQPQEQENIKEMVEFAQEMKPEELTTLLDSWSDRKVAGFFKYLGKTKVSAVIQTWIDQGGESIRRVNAVLDLYHKIVIVPTNQTTLNE